MLDVPARVCQQTRAARENKRIENPIRKLRITFFP